MRIDLDRERFEGTMAEQAAIGATDDGGLDRLALTDADREVRDWFVSKLEAAGLDVRIDAMGNTFGRREGVEEERPVLVGSHLDSQPKGGIYDGPLGVLAALECLRTVEDRGIETTRPIEIVNWTNEEGSRFQPAMMGSGVWAGAENLEEVYATTDRENKSVEEELDRIGYLGETPAEPGREYDAYLELHIEQGPLLERAEAQVGTVTGVVGLSWGELVFRGEPNHTGPTPMHLRGDALVAASDTVSAIRRLPTALGERTVATVGSLSVVPDSVNVIPGEARMTWDVRDPEDSVVETARERVLAEARAAAEREGVSLSHEDRLHVSSVAFADRCIEAVAAATEACGYDARRLPSGAGHDATHLAGVCDTGMVFAVSEEGISHSPAEYTSPEDCYAAANTLANATLELAGSE
jgi:N-carbamoyl-L-amino-acid hydrolase